MVRETLNLKLEESDWPIIDHLSHFVSWTDIRKVFFIQRFSKKNILRFHKMSVDIRNKITNQGNRKAGTKNDYKPHKGPPNFKVKCLILYDSYSMSHTLIIT